MLLHEFALAALVEAGHQLGMRTHVEGLVDLRDIVGHRVDDCLAWQFWSGKFCSSIAFHGGLTLPHATGVECVCGERFYTHIPQGPTVREGS